MTIGIVCYASYGGSGAVATELGIALGSRGHKVHFFASQLPFRLSKYRSGISFHQVDPVNYPVFHHPHYTLALASKIAEMHHRYRFDIVHVHYAIPHSLAALLAQDAVETTPFKVITTLHGTDITLVGQEPSYRTMVRHGIRRSNGVTAVSKYLKEETKNKFDIDRHIEVVYNFVDTDRFCPERSDDCPPFNHTGEINVAHVSNFREVKNIPVMIRAFAEFRSTHKARLYLMGEGPELSKGLTLAEELGVADSVTPMGRVDYLSCLLPNFDMLLLPSQSESFGLSVLEALSCGVPCVTSDRGGLPEVQIQGQTGFMVHPDDVYGLVEGMGRLVDVESGDRRKFREQARAQALNFGLDAMVNQYESYYSQIMDQ